MDKKELISNSNILLQKLLSRFKRLEESNDKIPAIEMNLILSDIAKLYDSLLSFNQPVTSAGTLQVDNNYKQDKKVLIEQEIEAISAKFPTINKILEKNKSKESIDIVEEKSMNTVEVEEKQVVIKEIIIENPHVDMPVIEDNKPKISINEQQSILAEKFKDDKKTINDLLSANQNTIGGNLQQNSVDDLKKIIGINEKFLFIKSLFNGDEAAYHKEIEALNSYANRETAFDYIQELSKMFGWKDDNAAFVMLKDFVKRRYTV